VPSRVTFAGARLSAAIYIQCRCYRSRSLVVLTEEKQFNSLVQTFDAERMRIVQEGFEKRDLLAARTLCNRNQPAMASVL